MAKKRKKKKANHQQTIFLIMDTEVCPFAERQHVKSNILFMLFATVLLLAISTLCIFFIVYESGLGRLFDFYWVDDSGSGSTSTGSAMRILLRAVTGIVAALVILVAWLFYGFLLLLRMDTRLYNELGLQISIFPLTYFGWQRTILFEEIVRYCISDHLVILVDFFIFNNLLLYYNC